MHAVSLAARKQAHSLLLVGSGEIEASHISARVHLPLTKLDGVFAAGDFFPDRLAGLERVAALIDIAELCRLANTHHSAIGLFLAGDHSEQCSLPGAVWTDHTDDSAGRKREGHAFDQQVIAISLGDVFSFDDDIPQPRSGRYVDLQISRAFLAL